MNLAKLLSYSLHPVVIPCIATMLYFSKEGVYYDPNFKILLLLATFIGTYLIPVLGLLVLKQLGLIDSLTIPKVSQRKYPSLMMLVVSTSFSILFHYTFNDPYLKHFYLASVVSILILLWAQHKNFKISIHMIGIASLLGFVIYLSYHLRINQLAIIGSLSIMSGLIAWSRLSLNAHNKRELFVGLIVGLIPQILFY